MDQPTEEQAAENRPVIVPDSEFWNYAIQNQNVHIIFDTSSEHGDWHNFDPKTFAPLWINECKLPVNQALRYLDRVEGGLCSENEDKQLRFKTAWCPRWHQESLVVFFRNGYWTYEEVVDLRDAFVAAMEKVLGIAVDRPHYQAAQDEYWAREEAFCREHGYEKWDMSDECKQAYAMRRLAEEKYEAGGQIVTGEICILNL